MALDPVVQWLPLAILFASKLVALHGRPDLEYAGGAAGCGLGVAVSVLFSWGLPSTVCNAALTAVWLWLWWRNRRKGRWKRAARAVGAKSAARLAALVRNLKPAPRPALRPARNPA